MGCIAILVGIGIGCVLLFFTVRASQLGTTKLCFTVFTFGASTCFAAKVVS